MTNKYLTIIPARGGSKRLPKKNILDLKGKPLISYTIEAAINSEKLKDIYVSSDSDEILTLARNYNCNTLKRPDSLATDSATTFDAAKHLIDNISKKYEYLVLLQPTSPLRNEMHINDAVDLIENNNIDSVVSVCEVDHSPLWCNTLSKNNSMDNFISEDIKNNRSQDLEKYYRLNGAIYICRITRLLEDKTFLFKDNILAYIMNRMSSIDIDEEIDFIIAKSILEYE